MTTKDLILKFHKSRDIKFYTNYFVQNPNQIVEIISLIEKKEKYPFSEYGSWLLTHIVKLEPSLILPFEKQLIDIVLNEVENQSVLRNCSHILLLIPTISYKESELMDRLISFINNSENKVALQVYSMYNLVEFVRKYPELKTEVTSIVEIYFQERSAAYKAGVNKFLKRIKNF
jgi:hypothetical protein